MARFLWICLGGAVGTGARYLLSGWLLRTAGPGFPWGTLAVNVLGSFLLGLIMQVAVATDLLSPTLRLTLTTGVMGGFTTYSTFNYETLQYLQQNDWLMGSLNLAVTVVACLAAGTLGLFAGRLLAAT
ncbi:MAG: fluoride efflux transporter CrcB [Acidobacteria bacterium]|nr:fluoride efflux transporter CrcB [Acidobacteriota bacterium]